MMTDKPLVYLAGVGMITPVGANTETTVAAINADISGYAVSDFYNKNDEPITMASIPEAVFSDFDAEIEEGDRYNERHDRIVKMAITALREAAAGQNGDQPIPLILAIPEGQEDIDDLSPLLANLEKNCNPWVDRAQHRSVYGDRASGMEAIDLATRYLYDLNEDFVLVGGSDSFRDYPRLALLDAEDRLLTESSMDGFAPGEAACFLLLTRRPELAMVRENHIIAIHPPGISEEPGHMGSKQPYLGEGLDQAFKKALVDHPQAGIQSIFSSMNGESHWAKEYGVAYLRNKEAFSDAVEIEHPADKLGDVGNASGSLLIALAAEHLFSHFQQSAGLVYCSSDMAKRGAVVVEKLPLGSTV